MFPPHEYTRVCLWRSGRNSDVHRDQYIVVNVGGCLRPLIEWQGLLLSDAVHAANTISSDYIQRILDLLCCICLTENTGKEFSW